MYKNACRFMQRSAFQIRLYEADHFYFESENERPLRVGRTYTPQGAKNVDRNLDRRETALAHAMSRAGIKLG